METKISMEWRHQRGVGQNQPAPERAGRGCMGSWGLRTFDDDTALDICADLIARPTFNRLARTLTLPRSGRKLSDRQATKLLVAAELIAALHGHPSRDLPEEALEWARTTVKGALPTDASRKARQGIATVVRSSGLRDLWADAGTLSDWIAATVDLKARLSAKERPLPRPRRAAARGSPRSATTPAISPDVAVGAAYLIPLERGFLGVCRVLRAARGDDLTGLLADLPARERDERARLFVVVATTPWVGRSPPRDLRHPDLRRVLWLTHHDWKDAPAPQVYVAPIEAFEPDLRLIGRIAPSAAEKKMRGVLSNMWTWRDVQLIQKEWDAAQGNKTAGKATEGAQSNKPRRTRQARR